MLPRATVRELRLSRRNSQEFSLQQLPSTSRTNGGNVGIALGWLSFDSGRSGQSSSNGGDGATAV
jgi:hypothetical protein